MKELTLVTCSYNTPEVTIGLLKTFYYHHKNVLSKFNIVLMENSTNDDTTQLLKENNVPFYRRPGLNHSVGVNEALLNVKTRYALLVDTDIIFHKSIVPIYNIFKINGYATLGKIMGSRGGYNLVPRVFPWFQLIDMKQINDNGISFHSQERIDRTGSNGFFGNIPLQRNEGRLYYDVGSSFLEDIINKGLTVHNVDLENNLFTHYEGMSWQKNVPGGYAELGNQRYALFFKDAMRYNNVNIKNRFV